MTLVTADVVVRLQPVEPSAFVIVRSKPPEKKPHEMFAAVRRSPMFWPPIVPCAPVEGEQTSPIGSASLIIVSEPLPPSVSSPVPFNVSTTPLVWPEIRFSAPGVDGPNVVLYELSLIAKRCA